VLLYLQIGFVLPAEFTILRLPTSPEGGNT
jgi:hypothetical protein